MSGARHLNIAWSLLEATPDLAKLDDKVLQACRTMFMLGSLAALDTLQTGNTADEIASIHEDLRKELELEFQPNRAKSVCKPASDGLH